MTANTTCSTNATSSSKSKEITFYDIAFAPPYHLNTCAPNPWKTRYALNFKDLPYTTHWTQMLDIPTIRTGLNIPAGRKFADGTDYHTLPIIVDPNTSSKPGDSFDIAIYLDTVYPLSGAGPLFPPQDLPFECPRATTDLGIPLSKRQNDTQEVYAKFNTEVDMAFTLHVQLMMEGMHWDPANESAIKAEFARRMDVAAFEDMAVHGEQRQKLKAGFKDALGGLATLYKRDCTGPFLLGKQPSYADCIVGGWLRMASVTLPPDEWAEFRLWYAGVFGSLHDALQESFGVVR